MIDLIVSDKITDRLKQEFSFSEVVDVCTTIMVSFGIDMPMYNLAITTACIYVPTQGEKKYMRNMYTKVLDIHKGYGEIFGKSSILMYKECSILVETVCQ